MARARPHPERCPGHRWEARIHPEVTDCEIRRCTRCGLKQFHVEPAKDWHNVQDELGDWWPEDWEDDDG